MTLNHRKFAINDKKQAELDSLAAQVTRTEYKVNQLQAIVNSLTAKQGHFDTALNTADTNRASALNNLTMVKDVVASIKEMVRKADTVASQTDTANTQINTTAKNISTLINQLIYSVEVINKLTLLINKKQASKVLISAELVSTVNTASSDANSAIALTLTALNSCNAAMVSGGEANGITLLEQTQSLHLFGLVTGNTQVIEDQLYSAKALLSAKVAQSAAKENFLAALKAMDWTEADLGADDEGQQRCDQLLVEAGIAKVAAQAELLQASSVTALSTESVKEFSRLDAAFLDATDQIDKLAALRDALTILIAANTALVLAKAEDDKAQAALDKVFAEYNAVPPGAGSLYNLLDEADIEAKEKYDFDLEALGMVNRELAQASANLVSATVDLNSLKAGLAAATAAALAA
jgi:hypothetical protein